MKIRISRVYNHYALVKFLCNKYGWHPTIADKLTLAVNYPLLYRDGVLQSFQLQLNHVTPEEIVYLDKYCKFKILKRYLVLTT